MALKILIVAVLIYTIFYGIDQKPIIFFLRSAGALAIAFPLRAIGVLLLLAGVFYFAFRVYNKADERISMVGRAYALRSIDSYTVSDTASMLIICDTINRSFGTHGSEKKAIENLLGVCRLINARRPNNIKNWESSASKLFLKPDSRFVLFRHSGFPQDLMFVIGGNSGPSNVVDVYDCVEDPSYEDLKSLLGDNIGMPVYGHLKYRLDGFRAGTMTVNNEGGWAAFSDPGYGSPVEWHCYLIPKEINKHTNTFRYIAANLYGLELLVE